MDNGKRVKKLTACDFCFTKTLPTWRRRSFGGVVGWKVFWQYENRGFEYVVSEAQMEERRRVVKRVLFVLALILLVFIGMIESEGEREEWTRSREEVQSFTERFVARAAIGDLIFIQMKEGGIGVYRIKNVSQQGKVFATTSVFLEKANHSFSDVELANIYGKGGTVDLVPRGRADEALREIVDVGEDFAYK